MSTNVKGLWTKKELAEAHQLAEASQASTARWAFADWLLGKEPMALNREHTGSGARLHELASELGTRFENLVSLRATAHAWPLKHRVAAASFSAHERYRRGGPGMAETRALCLQAAERDLFGKIKTMSAPSDQKARHPNIGLDTATHAAVVAEAKATGLSIAATARELLNEALDARAWLASELAA